MRNFMKLVEALQTPVGQRLYHVTKSRLCAKIVKNGLLPQDGEWEGTEWQGRIYLATSFVGAYEFALNFQGEALALIEIDASKIPGQLHDDEDFDLGVWTDLPIPPSAFTGVEKRMDDSFFDSEEFQKHMGMLD